MKGHADGTLEVREQWDSGEGPQHEAAAVLALDTCASPGELSPSSGNVTLWEGENTASRRIPRKQRRRKRTHD